MFELTNPQLAFYGADKAGVGQCAVLCGSVIVPRVLEESELQRAANEVLRINDGLRTRYVEKDGKVYQEFKPFEEKPCEVLRFESKEALDAWGDVYATIPLKLDIRSEGSGVPKSRWRRKDTSPALIRSVLAHSVATKIKQKRYKIKVEPACSEIKLVYLPDACGAVVKMHHLVSDAWTMLLVANQFIRILNGEEPKAYQYEDFVKSEEAYRKSKRYEKDCAFFEKQLERGPGATLLWPKPVTNLAAVRTTITLDEDETSSIKLYAQERGVSPYTLFLAAMSVYMNRKLQRDAFWIGSVVINRSGIKELNTAGMFTNAIPLLVEFREGETFAEAVVDLNTTNFACFRHEKGCQDNRLDSLMYDMWVSYQDATLEVDPTAECTQYYCNYAAAMKIFTVEDRSKEGRFKIHFDHNRAVTGPEVDEMFRIVLNVLRDGIADEGKKISELGC